MALAGQNEIPKLKEATLRDFFLDRCTAEDLQDDLLGTVERGAEVTRFSITDLDEEFTVKAEHLVRICDAIIAGSLRPADLAVVGFCLEASESFHWDSEGPDGDLVADALAKWASPEINYPLTFKNVVRFKARLLGDPQELLQHGTS